MRRLLTGYAVSFNRRHKRHGRLFQNRYKSIVYEEDAYLYDADRIAKRVAEIYDMDSREFLSKGKQQLKVRARSLFCFWAVKELGMSLREPARRLGISSPAVGYSVERGEMSSLVKMDTAI